jgi:hypothetical protein
MIATLFFAYLNKRLDSKVNALLEQNEGQANELSGLKAQNLTQAVEIAELKRHKTECEDRLSRIENVAGIAAPPPPHHRDSPFRPR